MIRIALLTAMLMIVVSRPAQAEIEIVALTSPGGIEAWLYEDHTIPILTVEASFLGGPAPDPVGREGATYMMAALLQEGAGGLDASAFATKLEELASPMGFWATDDAVSVSATMLTETRDETVELLRLALTRAAVRFRRGRAAAGAGARVFAHERVRSQHPGRPGNLCGDLPRPPIRPACRGKH